MRNVWNIVRKDARRIRAPLAIFAIVLATQIAWGAYVGGIMGQARVVENGILLRGGGEDVFIQIWFDVLLVYFLVGWLAYEDPVAVRDPFWLTRPVSGGELLGAKLCGTAIFFVLLPLILHLPWWLGAGFGPAEMAAATGQVILEFGTIAILALAVAAVTNGFPRFLLWTLVSAGIVTATFGMVEFSDPGGGSPLNPLNQSIIVSRVIVLALALDVVALAVLLHQYATLRLARSIVIGGAGMLAACFVAATSKFDLLTALGDAPPATGRIIVSGVPRYTTGSGRGLAHLEVPLKAEGVSDRAYLAFEWSADWKAGNDTIRRTAFSRDWFVMPDAEANRRVRRMAGLPTEDVAPDAPVASLSEWLSNGARQRLVSGPSSLHAEVTLLALVGEVVAEFPLQESIVRTNGHSYSLAMPGLTPFTEAMTRQIPVQMRQALAGDRRMMLAFNLTIRSQAPLVSDGSFGGGQNELVVVLNRKRGELLIPYSFFGSNFGDGIVRGVRVGFGRFGFSAPAEPGWIDSATIAVIGFRTQRSAPQPIDLKPLVFRAPTERAGP